MEFFYKELFEYNNDANIKILNCFLNAKISDTSEIELLYCHILNAHEIWNSRIFQNKPEYEVWQIHTNSEWAVINQRNFDKSKEILSTFSTDKQLIYANSKGKNFKNTISEILSHLINHSTHHRAQIAQLLSQKNVTVPTTDYIFYKRTAI